ncbi:MAG: lipase maturation factor family protein, partial [Bryobacteraceae bacterium]
PTPLAYYAYRLPVQMLDAMTGVALAIELGAPWLLFGPRRIRQAGAWCIIVLQVTILVTGNYAFFNLLTLALCVWCFDDHTFECLSLRVERPFRLLCRHSWRHWFHFPDRGRIEKPVRKPALQAGGPLHQVLSIIVAVLMVIGGIEFFGTVAPPVEAAAAPLIRAIAPFEIVNTYGLFAVMTKERPEIVIEGSDDGVNWREYTFRYKPGPLRRGLPIVAPYQPRLDWQMWFAALGDYQENSWVGGLMYRLLEGDKRVLGLMEPPPFKTPPRYLRAQLYLYNFTVPAERARTGAVWQRSFVRTWLGPVSLRER